jgi:hypothetical protein
MDTDSILATGGASGITSIVLFILYKLLQKRIRSSCCGQTVEIDIDTPKNIEVKVENAAHESNHSSTTTNLDTLTGRSTSSKNSCGVSRQGGKEDEEEGRDIYCPDPNAERKNTLHIAVPESV